MRIYAHLAALALAAVLCSVARADSGTIFFSNRTGLPYKISFVSANSCVVDPDKSAFTVDKSSTHVYAITLSSSCDNAQISWQLFQDQGGLHRYLSTTITYQRYKGTNGKWLGKVSMDPRPPRLVFKSTCGTAYTVCQQIGVPSPSVHAVINVFTTAEVVQQMTPF